MTNPRLLPFLGLACAVGVSSIYYNQPLLLEMAYTFHTSPAHIGLVATATQMGYAAGLLFLVPLGDVVERRALMMRMFTGVGLALIGVGISTSPTLLVTASALTGALASVTHIVLPLASDVTEDRERGRAIGTVMTGLLSGILVARTFSGWVSTTCGWRIVFLCAGAINLALAPLVRSNIPVLPPKRRLNYQKAILSLWILLRSEPLLRESCTVGALAFASFSCFWTTLVFLLQRHYNLGPCVAGTFGLAGISGALIAPLAGRKADRRGSRYAMHIGLATLGSSYLILWAGELAQVPRPMHLAILVMGVVVLDLGAQIMQVANQTRVLGLIPSARSRLNTTYMTIYFAGGALGSWLGSKIWDRWHANGVFCLAVLFIGLAATRHAKGVKSESRPAPMNTEGLAVSAEGL